MPSSDDEFDSGDDLFADVDLETLISPPVVKTTNKRALSPDSFGGSDVFTDLDVDEFLSSSQPQAQMSPRNAKRVKFDPDEENKNVELARKLLREKFGYDSFRHEQEKVIQCILRGENTLVIFPTGAGKSLCYQIPAIAFEAMDKERGTVRPHGSGLTIVCTLPVGGFGARSTTISKEAFSSRGQEKIVHLDLQELSDKQGYHPRETLMGILYEYKLEVKP